MKHYIRKVKMKLFVKQSDSMLIAFLRKIIALIMEKVKSDERKKMIKNKNIQVNIDKKYKMESEEKNSKSWGTEDEYEMQKLNSKQKEENGEREQDQTSEEFEVLEE